MRPEECTEWWGSSGISALVPAAEPVAEHPGPRPRPHGLGVGYGSGGTGVDRPQGPGKQFGVLHGLEPVRLGADPEHDVLLGDGSGVAVVRFALGIAAAGRTHVQPLATGPGNGQRELPDGVRGLVVLWLGVHVA